MIASLINVLLKLAPYIAFAVIFSRMDTDFTLWFYEKFGKKPAALKGKVIWIIGASSGIGEYLAYVLAGSGCKLALSGTREAKLKEVKQACLQLNTQLTEDDILTLAFDVCDIDNHDERFRLVTDHFGALDILACNAGKSQRAAFEETEIQVDREMFETNVFGLIRLSRLACSYWFKQSKPGHIVVTSSTAGKCGAPFSATYTATKHALHGYFEGLRMESFQRGLRITMVLPGPVHSEILGKSFTEKSGKAYSGELHGPQNRRMPTSRCAELMAIAIANQLSEAWISQQPVLLFHYLYQYFPSIAMFLGPRLLTKERIMRIREGN